MNRNDYQNGGPEYSDIDAEPVVGTVVKDVDSTIFSLRDNMRKGGPEGYMSKQGYLKNKSDSDHKNLGKSFQDDLERHTNSQNYTSAFQVEKSNQLPADDDLGTPPRVGGHEQNGYDFTLHTTAKDQNTRRKGTGDALESGSKVIKDFNPPTEMREPSEDGVGDDEPTFPIILNKRELLKDQNRSHENRFVSQEPDDDEDPNDDGAEGGDVPERGEPEEQDELEELEEQEEQYEDEENDRRSIEQKAIINKNNSKLKTKVQPKKPQISLNAIKNTRATNLPNQKIQEKKKSISITSKSPRNNENENNKSDIDGILKQLAAFLANNTQGKGAAATSNMTSGQIDKKIKKLGKNPIKTLPPKKLLDNENESKPKVQKPKTEKPTRPSKKGGALPNLGIRYAYGDQNAPKNKSYTITEKIRANSRPKYMDAVRNPTQTPSPVHRITPNANLADLQKKQAAFDLSKPRTATNAQRGFSQDNKRANETNGGRAERSKRISSNLLRPTPNPTRTFIKPSIRVEAVVRKSQDQGNLSARSSKSDLHAQQTSITPKKLNTNRSARGSGKKDIPQFDNNHLVRALYRVDRAVSKRSLSARSDGHPDKRRSPSVTDSTLLHDEMRDGVALRTENNDALRSRPNYFQNSAGPTDEDRNHTSIDAKKQEVPTTVHHIQQQRNSLFTPNRSRSNFTRNDSFISPSQRDSSARRNKQSIDRFAKDWEQYKRKVERGVISQNRPQIEFISNQPQHSHYSTKGAGGFDRSARFSSVTTRSGHPGPGRYHFVDSSLKGYSFGKEKRADMTSLYVVQDVNKMFDPIRMPH